MNHYFKYNENQASNYHLVKFIINDKEFELLSDDNVFSSKKLDEGTKILIKVLLKSNLKGSFLDLGCGYGPIGLVIKYFNKEVDVTLSDINKRCVDLSNINKDKLNIDVNVIESDSFNNISRKFDCISLNSPISIGKELIFKMYQESKEHLNLGGEFYLVIRKDKGAKSHLKYLSSLFNCVSVIYKEKGYYVLLAK